MGKRGSNDRRRYMGGRPGTRGNTPGPHKPIVVEWCYPKDPVDPSIQYPELDTDVSN
jgi:hypothetical protein